jgi:hypothetical protein
MRSKSYNGGSPSAAILSGETEGDHVGKMWKYGMDRPPQGTAPLAMDDPHLEDAPLTAEGEVVGHQILDLPGIEVMEVEYPINGNFYSSIWVF